MGMTNRQEFDSYNIRMLCPAGGGDFNGSFDMLLTFDLPKIKFLFTGSRVGPIIS
jgi:hypothetical protein